jgi:hypothetical protein
MIPRSVTVSSGLTGGVHGESPNLEHFLDFAKWHDFAMRDPVVPFLHLLATVRCRSPKRRFK